ncbi:hypothetical protein [Bradyrhizobium sp. Ai1a-2]|uniref:hypothetical protein n=1 Tax=Bradyrhizobium sp. Ai1a-2 TaxID=196490 RepID=UPI001268A80C|nr:hypothetical protein [Bradyrhizobium sp. Ai1a-2]
MSLDAKQLAQEITQTVRAAAAAHPAGGAAAEAVGGDFCSIWPKAKPVLELLAGIVAFIPGLGATAGAVLQGLIKVGDKIAEQACH